jgi:hypothetical protein
MSDGSMAPGGPPHFDPFKAFQYWIIGGLAIAVMLAFGATVILYLYKLVEALLGR